MESDTDRMNAGLGRTIPALPVANMDAAVERYRSALGFEALVHEDDFAALRRDDAVIHLWLASDEAWATRASFVEAPVRSGAETFLAGTASCRIEVADIDALFTELRAAGAVHHTSTEVVETDYGAREFHAVDRDGNLLGFHAWVA